METVLLVLLGFAFWGLMMWFIIWLVFLLPAEMARDRSRDPVSWVLVSLLGSPFLAIFLLWLLGDAPQD
jgi:hypothetical protein